MATTRIRLSYLGSRPESGSIAPSCAVLDIAGSRIVVDCGIIPDHASVRSEGRGWFAPDLSKLDDGKPIDLVCVTHAHADHCGYLPALAPYLAKNASLLLTRPTAALLKGVLKDGLKEYPDQQKVLPFSEKQMQDVLKRRWWVHQPGHEEVLPGVECLVHPEGHIPGACSFTFKVNGVNVHFSGDRCSHHQPGVLGAPPLPAGWEPHVIAGSDCTYGADPDSDSRTWRGEMDRGLEIVAEAVKAGRRVLICAFATHRGGAIAEELCRSGIAGMAPVWMDGACGGRAEFLSEVCEWSGRESPFKIDDRVRIVEREDWRQHHVGGGVDRLTDRDRILADGGPFIIVASPGMGGPAGAAAWWRSRLVEDPKALIVFSGYVAPDSDGYAIAQAAEHRERTGEVRTLPFVDVIEGGYGQRTSVSVMQEVRCGVARLRTGSHDSRGKIVDWFGEHAPRAAVLTHGSDEAFASLKEELDSGIERVVRSDHETSVEFDL